MTTVSNLQERNDKEVSAVIVYDSIKRGLNEAVEYEKGRHKNVEVDRITIVVVPRYRGVEVKKIRLKHGLTQQALAIVLGVSKKTVEAWESGRNIPKGPAQRLLDLLNKDKDFLNRYAIVKHK